MPVKRRVGSSRALQKGQTHLRLTRSAARMFAAEGISRPSTQRIAREAGVSHGTLFLHFPSRESLIVGVSEEFSRTMTDRLAALVVSGGATLREVLETHLASIRDQEALYSRFVAESAFLPPAAMAAWVGLQSAVSRHINGALQAESLAGNIRRVSPHLLFNTWIALVHHYLINRQLFSPEGSVVEEKGQELLEHYLDLLQRPKD